MNLLDKLTVNLCTNTLHEGNCCGKAYAVKGEVASTATRLDGKGGFDAYFVPTVADHTYTGQAGEAYPTNTGQTDVSGKWYPSPHTPVSTAGYVVEVIDAADPDIHTGNVRPNRRFHQLDQTTA